MRTINLKTVVVISLFLLGIVSTATGQTIFVDADVTGNNDGTNWPDAYNYLQDALTAAQSGDEIWVAEGIYRPDQGATVTAGDRTATFRLKNGVAIYGGYAGFGEADPNARDIELYETALSGDLNGDDGSNFTDNDENGYHVVTGSGCDETAVLDGFTITAGNANAPILPPSNRPNFFGGGIFIYRSSPTISNCTLERNSATYGGGMFIWSFANPTITNCIFANNVANYRGGGIYNSDNSDTVITNCIFTGNWAKADHGGGFFNGNQGCPILIHCTFTGNRAERGHGGGVYNFNPHQSFITLTNCIFWLNIGSGSMDERAQVHGEPIVINYCCIQGWTGTLGGTGNIGDDPYFVTGLLGDFYLSQVAAGQSVDSPCVDAGSDLASVFGLDQFTTRTDHEFDAGIVDMGYHYMRPANTPPVADADGPYTIYVGDTLMLDASGSTDADDDIVSYMWDLNDDETFETDAGGEAVLTVDYTYLESLSLIIDHTYTVHLKVTDSQGQSDVNDSTLLIIPKPAVKVTVDIKPGTCPNPVNVKSKGVLPIAILGTDDYDVTTIDPTSVRLTGVEPIRSSYEDVATPVSDSNDCNCTEEGPDGFLDLTLKFKTQKIVEAIGDVNDGDELQLELIGVLFDETPIEGADCILIRGRHKPINPADINKDGVVNAADFALIAQNWLQSSIVDE